MPHHCVLKDWVLELPYRMQSVLISSLRGCDTARKDDPSKAVTRSLRALVLRNADPTNSFIGAGVPKKEAVEKFLWDLDSYPMHFVAHTMHAAEIVGYKYTGEDKLSSIEIAAHKKWWLTFYRDLVKALHLNPEQEAQLDVRLGFTAVDEEDLEKEARASRQWDAGTGTSHGGRNRKWSGGS